MNYKQQLKYLLTKNNNPIKSEIGLILELYTCIKHNAILYIDVPESVRSHYNLTNRDEGIDCIKIDEHDQILEIYQCKNYDGYLSHHELGTFYNWVMCLNKFNVKNYLIIKDTTKFYQATSNPFLNIEVITDDEINEIVKDIEINKQEIKFELRDYQNDAIEYLNDFILSSDEIFKINMCCGSGKTVIFTEFIKTNTDLKFLIIVPYITIAECILIYFNEIINTKWTNQNTENKNSNVYLCVDKSVNEFMNIEFDVIIIDEAHHYIRTPYELPKHDKIIMFSATIDDADYIYDYDTAIDDEYINDYKIDINFINNTDDGTEFINVVNKYYNHNLIFCNSIETANYLNSLFKNNSMVITSEVDKNKRMRIIKDFEANRINNIISVNCLNEGVNIIHANNAIFYNDRSSPINIIQCLGRVLRKYEGKPQFSRMVLFANCTELAEIKYQKYIKALSTHHFKNVVNKINCYSHTNNSNEIIKKYENEMFERITKSRIDWVEITKQYINQYGNILPKKSFIFNNIKYGVFIHNLKHNNYKNLRLKNDIKNLFGFEIKYKYKSKEKNDWVEITKQYINQYGKILPKRSVIFNNVKYGTFIKRLKQNHYKDIKPKIEQLFEQKIEKRKQIDWVEISKQYIAEYGKILPKYNFKFKNIDYGVFINCLKCGDYKKLKPEIEQLFEQKIEKRKQIDWVEITKQYIAEYGKILPKSSFKFKNHAYGAFIKDLKHNNCKNIKNDIENLFEQKIEKRKRIDWVEITKQYINQYGKILPSSRFKFNGYNYGSFINSLKHNQNKKIKPIIESLFNFEIN